MKPGSVSREHETMPAKPKEPLSAEELHKLFEYRDGWLYRKESVNAKNGKGAKGTKVGYPDGKGYLVVSIRYKKYLVHRLVWIMHGQADVPFIDHIDGDKLNNRIENLREANYVINNRNAGLRRDSTSGIKGVSWIRTKKRWTGQVWCNGKLHHAGDFKDKDDCAAAVRILREKLHGEYARH